MSPVAQLIQHADGRTYVREGECDGCQRPGLTPGYCCTFMSFTLSRPLSEDESYWASLHEDVQVDGSTLNLSVPCSALTSEGRCSLFGTPARPAMCERYPELPGQVLEGCSYILKEA